MFDQNQKLKEIVNSDKLETHLSLNLLINAVKSNWDNYSKLDQYLIGRALQTIEWHSDNKQDFIIEFSKNQKS